jgi:hypothetical protein
MNTKLYLVLLLAGICTNGLTQEKALFYDFSIYGASDIKWDHYGPAVSLGLGIQVSQKVSLLGSYTFFYSIKKFGEIEVANTVDVSVIYSSDKHGSKGFYGGGGLAYQLRHFNYFDAFNDGFVTATCNAGYRFPIRIRNKTKTFGIEVKAFGPYYKKISVGTLVDPIAQVMLGARLRF